MNEKLITQVVALVDIAMMMPAVMAVERDWLAPIYTLDVVLLAAIVAAAFVAVDHLTQQEYHLSITWVDILTLISLSSR